ncbi:MULTISPECIES: Gfo/Idh/MocA family protein [Flavobacteriaceae]|uniref:Gfo/Idh/MocA family protein n=1 Tax=Flavobacteriaceae TaxID=49546 RepID=UPI0014916164|nr:MULTISPECIES: Gfo/Idh/MocA family oxidoreductase [Allomuricauda]MDC6364564.1 Gfo/Idh/MocA family oxidoreductase [Muricauda sp. AC10]
MKKITRRKFNNTLVKGIGSATLMTAAPMACAMVGGQQKKKLGIALVGLGSYSTYQLAPALQDTQHCYLAGIVTGTPAKEKIWADKYGIPKNSIYNYQNFDEIANNDAIDIVYVVLPNSMHAEFSIRAAKAGKHVICEKPMAMNVAECDAIIEACDKAGVKLGIGYRLHSEPYTQEIKKIVAEKRFGDVRYISAAAGYYSGGYPNQWRLNKKLAGTGALGNMGVYAMQALIYGTGENPTSVSAQEFSTRPEYFKETDETITAQFEFPSGAVGNMMTSHNISANEFKAYCQNGWYGLDPATSYGPLHGTTSRGEISFEHESQQKLQMDDFASHILYGTPNLAPGEMGRRDMVIIEAILQSIQQGGAKIALNFSLNYGFGG